MNCFYIPMLLYRAFTVILNRGRQLLMTKTLSQIHFKCVTYNSHRLGIYIMLSCTTILNAFILSTLVLDSLEARRGHEFDTRNRDIQNYNLIRSVRNLDEMDAGQHDRDKHAPQALASTHGKKTEYFQLELPDDYNMHELPKHSSGRPIEVLIQLHIRKILDLNEDYESIKIDLEFRALWTDYKIRDHFNKKQKEKGLEILSFSDMSPERRKNMTKTLNDPNMLDSIWKPNLFFGNLLQVNQPFAMSKPITLKLIPEIGAFEYLSRITVVTDCPMHFHYYPADTQECQFSIRSFSYTRQDLKLAWFKTGVWLNELGVTSFDVEVGELQEHFSVEDNEDPLSDMFDVFTFRLKARRRLSYHLVQTYLPSTFYIIITCLCFLVPPRFVEARIGIAMTTLLTLTAMFASVRESTPIVSYVKAIDAWMAGCVMFVFLTLAQFTFITWLHSVKENYTGKLKKADEETTEMEMVDIFRRKKKLSSDMSLTSPNVIQRYERLRIILEKFNFVIFIAILIFFSTAYWVWLLFCADYLAWSVDSKYNNVEGRPW